jgi:hypothetical protein
MKDNFVVLIIMILVITVIGEILFIIPHNTENTNKVSVVYQPMQCEVEPWQDENLSLDIYFSNKNITISEFKKIERSEIFCQACEVCPKSYYYTMNVYAKDLSHLKKIGFSQI